MKKTIRIKLKVKNSDLDIGYGDGVIADQTLAFDLDEAEYGTVDFQKSLLNHSNNLIRETVQIELEEL
jgi:hypothetical protein